MVAQRTLNPFSAEGVGVGSNPTGATMKNLKLIIEQVLSEMKPIPIYGNKKFWEEVDKVILEDIKNLKDYIIT